MSGGVHRLNPHVDEKVRQIKAKYHELGVEMSTSQILSTLIKRYEDDGLPFPKRKPKSKEFYIP